ncbi:type II secretion system F family protein [Pseudemcibacter aquimaris]|uniref:type II secretion system F family protein n=1 Tax=Pseudemcibacter aquimaris TaxID=2857064 RepID=UPI00201277D0|nr:type II secretion system F family protein [Pseudemcibacter aquimaris]MCC3861437.1 type II secretion system F family protein [Pseudemcibacter aquimaris]WDU58206.1 type II secretion system F family protein [Pseudemcibacter aquimaris]
MEQFLPDGITGEDVITLLAAASAFLVMMAIWSTGIVKDGMDSKIKSLQARRNDLKRGYVAPVKRRQTVKKKKSVGMMGDLVSKFNLVKNEQAEKYQQKLIQAGYRSKEALVIFMFFKIVMPVLVAIIAIIVVYALGLFELNQSQKLLVVVGSSLAASYSPELYLKNHTDKRNHEIQKSLPDMLDLLVICAEAGLTLDGAITRVVREMGSSNPELADEFNLTAIELGFLPERKIALQNLASRIDLPSIKAVTATLIQSERYGTPLAHSLRVLSDEFRNERFMKAEEKAARLPAIMTIPLILFILPTLFIVLLGSATCSINDSLINVT